MSKMTFGYLSQHMDFVEKRQDKELVIFGSGDRASQIIPKYFTYDPIKFICDNSPIKWGKHMMGIPIYSPEKLSDKPENYVVVIAIDDYVAIDSIQAQLGDYGVKNVFHFSVLHHLNTFWRYDGSLAYSFHELNTYPIVNNAAEKISEVRAMMSDEKSIKVFDSLVEKLCYNVSDYSDICDDWHDHYFSDNIFEYENQEVFVDGGGFDGADTIRLLKILGNRFKKAYVFEPDENNFARLCRNIDSLVSSNEELENSFNLFRMGLYDSAKDVGFIHWGNYGSRIAEGDAAGWSSTNGYSATRKGGISTVRLDDVIPETERVSLIKLDVEGAEIAALNGAKRIITKNQPKMALSIYHRIEDLWEIPLLIKSMVPEYKLYVRHHSFGLGDKVLYATK